VTEPLLAAQRDLLDTVEAGPRALRGSALRSAGYVAGLVLGLAAAPLLIRHLGVITFGAYVTATVILTIVSGLTEGGLNAVALRGYATSHGVDRDQLMRNALGARLTLSAAGVVVAIAFAAGAGYGSSLVLGVTFAGLGLILQLMQSILLVPLQSEMRLGWATLVDLVRQVVAVMLIVTLVLAGRGLVALLAVAIPASLVSLVLTATLVRQLTPLLPAVHPAQWWPLLRDSIPYAAAIAVNVLYFRLAVILTSLLAGDVETGYFSTSFRVVEVIIGLPALLIGAAFPILARAQRDDPERFRYATRRIFELALLSGTWLVVVLEAGAPFAVHVLAGSQANPAIDVLRIQGVGIVATFVIAACAFPLLSLRRYRAMLVSNIVALGVSASLVSALIPSLGARGAAIGAAAGEAALALLVAVVLIRAIPQLRLRLDVVAVAAAAGAAALAAGLALPAPSLVQAIVAAFVYLAALKLMRRLPPEAHQLVRGFRSTAVG